MSTEQFGIAPQALHMGFVQRVSAYTTDWRLGELGDNIDDAGIPRFLYNEFGQEAITAPWTTALRVTDGITYADAEPDPKSPPRLNLTRLVVDFEGSKERDRFWKYDRLVLAGIHGYETIPEYRPDGP